MKIGPRLVFCFVVIMFVISGVASAELYKRAPDAVKGTIPEMREPSYWIARMDDPDGIVMTVDDILRMNENYQRWVRRSNRYDGLPEDRVPRISYWWPGYVLYPPDLQSISPEAVADTVRAHIALCIEHMRKEPYGNLNAVEYAPWQIDEFEEEMAVSDIPSRVSILDAIAVRTARIRSVPTMTPDQVGIRENAKTRWDLWNVDIAKIGMPLKVLHRSKSGEYVFILCELGFGWIRTADIAFSYKAKIDEFVNADNFVVCTGDRVPFFSTETCTYSAGWFRMGDRLPIAPGGDPRKIIVPVRKTNGEFTTETAWLAADADVHVGFLPYTRRNVVVTAFNLLDNQYDWTGAWFGRQHQTTYRDIFRCFGFELPYHGGMFTFFNNNDQQVLMPDSGTEEQYRTILTHEPFVTLQSCGGHCQLLLGEYNGVPIIFDQHGYGYEDDNGDYVEVRRCCIGDQTMPSYFLKNKITFLVLKNPQ